VVDQYLPDECQPDALSIGFTAKKGGEKLVFYCFRNTFAIIADDNAPELTKTVYLCYLQGITSFCFEK
jgi:hypothetical protein